MRSGLATEAVEFARHATKDDGIDRNRSEWLQELELHTVLEAWAEENDEVSRRQAGTVASGNSETGQMGSSIADVVLIPLFKGLLVVISLIRSFSPIDSLSSGRCVTWTELGAAFGQIVLLLSGILGLIGIGLFNRRELATAQGNQ